MLKIIATTRFKKDVHKLRKRGYNLDLLKSVIKELSLGNTLDAKFRDHILKGNWSGYHECHISPDWLLIYRINRNTLILNLTRTGSHSDLLNM